MIEYIKSFIKNIIKTVAGGSKVISKRFKLFIPFTYIIIASKLTVFNKISK